VPYLIDGHNLIGRFPGLSLTDPEDERKLLDLLERFANRTRRRMVVFFDRGVSPSAPLSRGPVEVRFIRPPRQADEALVDYLRRLPDPQNWTVVTSDRQLARRAVARSARVLPSEQFSQHIVRALDSKSKSRLPHGDTPDLDEWIDLFGGEQN